MHIPECAERASTSARAGRGGCVALQRREQWIANVLMAIGEPRSWLVGEVPKKNSPREGRRGRKASLPPWAHPLRLLEGGRKASLAAWSVDMRARQLGQAGASRSLLHATALAIGHEKEWVFSNGYLMSWASSTSGSAKSMNQKRVSRSNSSWRRSRRARCIARMC